MSKLVDVEQRLEIASYYRLLLKQPLFSTLDSTASQVQNEVRDFIRGRLEVLVGLASSETSRGFSSEEVTALKILAGKLLEAEESNETPSEGPPKKRAQQPASPKRRRPRRRKSQGGGEANKEVSSPAKSVSVMPVRVGPEPKEVVKVSENKELSPPVEEGGEGLPPKVGDVIHENGRTYRIVDVDGKLFPLDITRQAGGGSANRAPMPTGAALEQALANKANEDLSTTGQVVALSMSY